VPEVLGQAMEGQQELDDGLLLLPNRDTLLLQTLMRYQGAPGSVQWNGWQNKHVFGLLVGADAICSNLLEIVQYRWGGYSHNKLVGYQGLVLLHPKQNGLHHLSV
jgi:hypothetical protein